MAGYNNGNFKTGQPELNGLPVGLRHRMLLR
jgi:hypothetical protein